MRHYIGKVGDQWVLIRRTYGLNQPYPEPCRSWAHAITKLGNSPVSGHADIDRRGGYDLEPTNDRGFPARVVIV